MRYLFLALITGVTVVGAGWVVFDAPIDNDWRGDLLELVPFSSASPGEHPTKRKRRKRRGKAPKAGSSSTGVPAPAPAPALAGELSQADVHYQLGVAYLNQKKIPIAIAELKKCIALEPSHAMAYRALGMAHSVMGKERSAVEAFKKFVQLAPKHPDADKVRAIIKAHEAGK